MNPYINMEKLTKKFKRNGLKCRTVKRYICPVCGCSRSAGKCCDTKNGET